MVRGGKQFTPSSAFGFMSVWFALTLLFTARALWELRRTVRAANVYVETTCRVLSTSTRQGASRYGGVFFSGLVRLEVVARGAAYEKTEAVGRWGLPAEAEAWLSAHYPVQSSVPCFYDPDAPAQLVLERSEPEGRSAVAMALTFDVIFGGFWIVTLVNYLRWRKKRAALG